MQFFERMLPGLAAIAVLAVFQTLPGGLDGNIVSGLAVAGTLATFLVAYLLNPVFAHGRRRWRKLWGRSSIEWTPASRRPPTLRRRR